MNKDVPTSGGARSNRCAIVLRLPTGIEYEFINDEQLEYRISGIIRIEYNHDNVNDDREHVDALIDDVDARREGQLPVGDNRNVPRWLN